MADTFTIEADWEVLREGAPEERACFAAIGIGQRDTWLTEAEDRFVNRVRHKVHLSAYRLAEWLAWNWWRLRWEPQKRAPEWALAHRMTTIGGGFVWPNITVFSDGERVALLARPTLSRPNEPFRYVADKVLVVRAASFEDTIDRFVSQVLGQLREEAIADTNLERIWQDVRAERLDPELAFHRRLEALLGSEPDAADDPELLDRLASDAATLGVSGTAELAADHEPGETVMTGAALLLSGAGVHHHSSPRDVVRLDPAIRLSPAGEVPAWQRGAEAARALRAQERLGAAPISNARLADLSGAATSALKSGPGGGRISFSLDESETNGIVVLRSKWGTGRRFELARLLGDRIASDPEGRFFPETRAYTYRQKLQRSFAVELLCPFEAVEEMLGGDCSDEKQIEVARHFDVSELAVRTLLVNHGLIDRDRLAMEAEANTV